MTQYGRNAKAKSLTENPKPDPLGNGSVRSADVSRLAYSCWRRAVAFTRRRLAETKNDLRKATQLLKQNIAARPAQRRRSGGRQPCGRNSRSEVTSCSFGRAGVAFETAGVDWACSFCDLGMGP